MPKWMCGLGDGETAGRRAMCKLLVGKGTDLAETSRIALSVPPHLRSGFDRVAEARAEAATAKRHEDAPPAPRQRRQLE